MTIEILASGSSGNAYIIEDKEGNQLLLECGIKFQEICKHINFEKLDCVLVGHIHRDHFMSHKEFEEACISVYSPLNTQAGNGNLIDLKHWHILSVPLTHNVECYGFYVYNKVEKKYLLYCSDTTSLPNIADRPFDCMLLECNYNYDKVIENAQNGKLTNDGYKNHMALEDLVKWLRVRECKPKHLVAIHLSNNGNIDKDLVLRELKPFGENVRLAKKGVKIEC